MALKPTGHTARFAYSDIGELRPGPAATITLRQANELRRRATKRWCATLVQARDLGGDMSGEMERPSKALTAAQ